MFKRKIIILIFILFPVSFVASQEVMIKNVHFEFNDELIFIYYDCENQNENDLFFEASLCSKVDSSAIINLKNISGDIGKGIFSGIKRKIIWDYKKDYSGKIDSGNFYFKITASKIESTNWYYYVGAAIIGGGIAAIILTKKNQDNPTTKPIGMPPLRP